MPAFLGGCRIILAYWTATTSLVVRFASTYSDRCHQLYAGRSLIGSTSSPTSRAIVANLQPSLWPQRLQLISVPQDEYLDDFGDLLPDRPYNRAQVLVTASGWPSDSRFLNVYLSQEAGGDIDYGEPIKSLLYDIDREYMFLTDPLPGSGEYGVGVAGADDKPPAGNIGDPIESSVTVLAHPPDVVFDGSSRFSVAVSGGVATFNYEVP